MKKLILAFITALLTLPLPATVFVNQDLGNDSHPGTRTQPVKTLRRAVALMRKNRDFNLDIARTARPYAEALSITNLTPPLGQRLHVNGHGATLTGLQKITVWERKGDTYFTPIRRWGALNPFALVDGTPWPRFKDPQKIQPGQTVWNKEGLYIRLPEGKTPDDFRIEGTIKVSGVAINNTSYVTVENLTCQYFANDGFNIHGSCHDLHFRNIEAGWNGDDGFSVHEDVGVTVTDARFHHNFYGIQDVNVARSQYHRVKVHDNLGRGVHFLGGFHALIDSEIFRNHHSEVLVQSYTARHMGIPNDSYLLDGQAYIANCHIHHGKIGIMVKERGRATLRHCTIKDMTTLQSPQKTENILIVRSGE